MSKPIPQHKLNTDSVIRSGAAQPLHRALRAMRKVPEITVYFWIIKLLTTAMGESTTDYLVYQINPYVAVALGCIGLAVALILQLLVRSEEHTSELQSRQYLVCRLLLEKKKL